ncbi:hypothetical protein JOD24_001389 [Kroppenstedtia sanguinis]
MGKNLRGLHFDYAETSADLLKFILGSSVLVIQVLKKRRNGM